jgi:hypothetical protein
MTGDVEKSAICTGGTNLGCDGLAFLQRCIEGGTDIDHWDGKGFR